MFITIYYYFGGNKKKEEKKKKKVLNLSFPHCATISKYPTCNACVAHMCVCSSSSSSNVWCIYYAKYKL